MSDLWWLLGMVATWYLLNAYVLPKFGFQT